MSRDGFVFYASFYQAMMKMSKADRLPFVEALCAYALEDKEPELTGSADLAFCLIKPQLDANIKRRDNGAKGKGFGVLGGRPKESKTDGDIDKNPIGVINGNPKQTPNVNVKDNVNVNVIKEKDKEKVAVAPLAPKSSPIKRFIKPTLLELQQYCQEARLNINCDAFLDYYEANGWKVGRDSMKDWRAAARNWARRQVPEKRSNIVDNIHNIGDFSNERTRI